MRSYSEFCDRARQLAIPVDEQGPLWDEYFQSRSTRARNRLVEANMHLVPRVLARQFYRRHELREDLLQWGLQELTDCISRYKPDRAKFDKFAVYAICQYLRKMIVNTSGCVRHITDHSGWKVKPLSAVYLDAPMPNGDSKHEMDQLFSTDDSDKHTAFEAANAVNEALEDLDPRLHGVLHYVEFGLHSLQEAGETIGVSRERARQLHRDAVEDLYENLTGRAPTKDELRACLDQLTQQRCGEVIAGSNAAKRPGNGRNKEAA